MRIKNKLIIKAWSIAWKNWLHEGENVVFVAGWRTALIDNKWGNRERRTPCFTIFNIIFD